MDAKDIAEELQDTDVVTPAAQAEEVPPEKMLSVSQVNELVKKAKRKGEQKMQEQLEAAQQQIQQLQAQQGQQQAPQQQGFNPEQMQAQMMAMMQKQMQEAEAKRQQEQLEKEVSEVAQQYFSKVAQGKARYEDFDAITADFDPAAFPQLVYLATQTDNTADIIYELQKNPAKLAQLSVLVDKSPAMARNEINKLAASIRVNEEAKSSAQSAQEPLNRLKSSPVGTDNGTKNVRDLKQASYLRV